MRDYFKAHSGFARACLNRCDARDDHGGNGGRRVPPPSSWIASITGRHPRPVGPSHWVCHVDRGFMVAGKIHQWNHRLRTPFVGASGACRCGSVTLPGFHPPFVTWSDGRSLGSGWDLPTNLFGFVAAVTEQAHHGMFRRRCSWLMHSVRFGVDSFRWLCRPGTIGNGVGPARVLGFIHPGTARRNRASRSWG